MIIPPQAKAIVAGLALVLTFSGGYKVADWRRSGQVEKLQGESLAWQAAATSNDEAVLRLQAMLGDQNAVCAQRIANKDNLIRGFQAICTIQTNTGDMSHASHPSDIVAVDDPLLDSLNGLWPAH